MRKFAQKERLGILVGMAGDSRVWVGVLLSLAMMGCGGAAPTTETAPAQTTVSCDGLWLADIHTSAGLDDPDDFGFVVEGNRVTKITYGFWDRGCGQGLSCGECTDVPEAKCISAPVAISGGKLDMSPDPHARITGTFESETAVSGQITLTLEGCHRSTTASWDAKRQ